MTALKQEEMLGTRHMVHGTPETAKLVPGRRDFFNYSEFGVEKASEGFMKAQIMKATQGLSRPTGWHYHTSEAQFVYGIKGWVDLEFESGESNRLEEGHTLYIPGGLRHNETATANELEILEVSVPAEMGTVACDAPK